MRQVEARSRRGNIKAQRGKDEQTHNVVALQDEDDRNLFRAPSSSLFSCVAEQALDGPLDCVVAPRDGVCVEFEEGPERLADDPVARFADPRFPVREGDEGEDDVAPGLALFGDGRTLRADEDAGADEGVKSDEAGKEQVSLLAGVDACPARGGFEELRQDARCDFRVGQEGGELREGDGEPLPRCVVGRGETRYESLEGIRGIGPCIGCFKGERERVDQVESCVDASVRVVRSEQREQGQDRLPR